MEYSRMIWLAILSGFIFVVSCRRAESTKKWVQEKADSIDYKLTQKIAYMGKIRGYDSSYTLIHVREVLFHNKTNRTVWMERMEIPKYFKIEDMDSTKMNRLIRGVERASYHYADEYGKAGWGVNICDWHYTEHWIYLRPMEVASLYILPFDYNRPGLRCDSVLLEIPYWLDSIQGKRGQIEKYLAISRDSMKLFFKQNLYKSSH